MKRIAAWGLIVACILLLPACRQKEDVLHLGVNAEIIEIDTDRQIIYVTDPGKDGIFGTECGIDCRELIENQGMIYVDYGTSDVLPIQFSDLRVGDAITLNIYESQLNGIGGGVIAAEQIQLATQRLDTD